MKEYLLGKLEWADLPHEMHTIGGSLTIISAAIVIVILLTRYKKWGWLWNDWLTSVDPKKIGIMYFIAGGFMLLRGGLDAIMIWLQQALAAGDSQGYLSAQHFQEIFTAHGNIMVFFVAMALIFGLINYFVPLQIGARDLASPFLNTLGFWLYIAGVIMVNMFFFVGGEYAAAGWLAVAPLSGPEFSTGVGMDYLIWSLQISGVGTTLGAINFIMTIIKMRAPGMSLMKMPLFTWGSLLSMIMAATVFPLLTATLFLMFFDRYLGTHFFTIAGGGDPMMYTNLIWMWGHPEVYILVLPAYGVFSEIVSTFSRKPIANYTSNVLGLIGVSALGLSVWLHHFYTMGAGANVNAFFGFMSILIAVPTTVLFFNWIATMYRGHVRFETPMLWFLGFVFVFAIGGITGVMLGIPPVDFQLHNSLFLVAHFHSNIIGGVLFGIFAGLAYWFPKIAGFRLNERIGKAAFWFWIVGFCMSFIPMYILGLMGATRRLDHYDASTGWQPLFILMFIGGLVIAAGVILQFAQILASYIQKKSLVDTTGDPWDGRTLEWATPSPAPFYNFTVIPRVKSYDMTQIIKQSKSENPGFEDIHMPKNTAAGIYISAFAFLLGFGFVWHIIWLVVVGIIGMIAVFIKKAFTDESEYTITASEVMKFEKERIRKLPKPSPADIQAEMGVWDLIIYIYSFGKDIVKHKRWKKW